MVFFTVTTCVWCVYFLYLSVLLAGKCHPRTDVGYMLHCHVDGEISPRRQQTISSVRLAI